MANFNDGKIDININKGIINELTPQDEEQPVVENRDQEKKGIDKQAITAALIESGKQAMQQGFNTYVTMSGDYQLQRQVELVTNTAADILIIAKGGPVGAIAVATKYALGAANAYVETKNENLQTNFNRSMLGQISKKGSRYW